ncbi:M20 family metallopeptidase [Catellatospora bangladeshensis]|uniref:Glutamate carboxypeptidase n=1 Tax=Catellatospora bangladeshensis TaxID=310355 RepID=A0A8J3NLU1_9ACTN|nr:M20 family metallopeptidase [Catellatospora bangladeshensis]GIF85422.1 glutamate carboxypeptidase [Catellatospora bangladeshensis]
MTIASMTEALPVLLSDIEELVTCESPSQDLAAVARSAEVVARLGARRLGAEPERIVLDGRTHLRWRFGAGPTRVLLLGHHDTVWPLGSLATHPFSVDGGVLRGPGCFDMKAGLAMIFHAVAALPSRDGVTILVNGDEELGSPSSRSLIETEAAGCAAALVLEASAPGGALKTERKGVSLYRVRVTGRAAHAGLEPERGVNATIELARQVLAVAALADPDQGTTVTPTLMSSGTTTNTVPALGEFAIDVRVRTVAEQTRIHTALERKGTFLSFSDVEGALPNQAGVEVLGGPNRPPLDGASSAGLYTRAQKLAAELRLPPLTCAAVGGASDGNFTAGVGTPTLDGLGAVGGGAHADDEHVLIDALPGRTALLTALIADLLAGGRAA